MLANKSPSSHRTPGEMPMRHPRLSLTVVASALLIAVAVPSIAQQGKGAPPQAPAVAPPKPYKPVAIELAPPVNDPSFEAFRKQLSEVAKRKDKAGLAKLVAANFFWEAEGKDQADKKKTPGDNIAAALALDKADAGGWDLLTTQADDPNASPALERKGVICAPAEPKLDPKAFDAVTKETGTQPFEWAFPIKDGVEVRGTDKADAPITEKLGMHLVRIMLE